MTPRPEPRFDAIVVGAGFGGLGAALALAEGGARVALLETLRYPGGCASTFTRDGFRFEAGATLFSGFSEGQLFRRWIDRYDLDVDLDWLDPIVELRAPGIRLAIPRSRQELVRRFAALPGAPGIRRLSRFFARQRQAAEALWSVLDEPELLPPFRAASLLRHLARTPRYARLLPWIGRPLAHLIERGGLGGFRAFRLYADALCQITVQCGSEEAEAPVALAAMDYYFRGTAHVRGGIGRLAWALVEAIRRQGGVVRLAERARSVVREADVWLVRTRGGVLRARAVVLNVLPQSLPGLVEPDGVLERATLEELSAKVERGWGACMLYAVVRPPCAGAQVARHFQVIADPERPLAEGNHVFCSISGPGDEGRCPAGLRTMTVSTHVDLGRLRALSDAEQACTVTAIQEAMRATLAAELPEWRADIRYERTASPRTFARFTGRHLGYVGGVPRRAGLWNYQRLSPLEVAPKLFLVGDSVFPGQSTLATAVGGHRVAAKALAGL
ncbi:MAG: FAD-binding protein [Planctomycetota bacterium]|nr:MAG: FAD-binding protein [Planctomycetota bacterium]